MGEELTLATKPAPVVNRLPFAKAQTELGRVARRAHRNKEYFIVEQDGAPVIGIMDADELEDYLELRDPNAQRDIRKSNEDVRAGRTRPAEPRERAPGGKRAGSGRTLGQRLMRFAGTVEGLPRDMARNHDHYIHGAPRE